jgi:ubiquinone/menaquinone biosynthesis C-methylase UbiE
MIPLVLPNKKNVIKTNPEDPIDFYYYPLIGWVYRKRLINTLSLVEGDFEKVLDVGYGSGLLFPSMLKFSKTCYGLETHGHEEAVMQTISREGLSPERVILNSGSILKMPYQDDFFDLIISVSTLEHIADLDSAMAEMRRVLKPGAQAVFSFPVRNPVTDRFYRLFGYNPREIHPSSHNDIVNAAKKFFIFKKQLNFPDFKNANHSLYCSILCEKAR